MKRVFKYGTIVRVKRGSEPQWYGYVYSEYMPTLNTRRICVQRLPNGSGVGVSPRWISVVKRPRGLKAMFEHYVRTRFEQRVWW